MSSSIDPGGSDGGAGMPQGAAPDRGWVLVADAVANMNRTQNDAHKGQVYLLWGIFVAMLLNLGMLWMMDSNEGRRHDSQIEVIRTAISGDRNSRPANQSQNVSIERQRTHEDLVEAEMLRIKRNQKSKEE